MTAASAAAPETCTGLRLRLDHARTGDLHHHRLGLGLPGDPRRAHGFGPLELGAVRFAIAAVPAALFLAVTRPKLPEWRDAWRFGFGGLVFVAGYTVLLNLGQQTVSAGAASFIININPIITAALAMLVLGERFTGSQWLGSAISLAGVGLIAFGQNGAALDLGIGVLLVLGAALCNSLTTIVQKPLFAQHKPLTVTAWNMVVGGLLLTPFLPSGIAQAQTASTASLYAMLYLAIVPSLITYATWTTLLSRLPARAPRTCSTPPRRWRLSSAISGSAKCPACSASSAARWRWAAW
jgi:drug/metabolite transporter (DMT)-like permease